MEKNNIKNEAWRYVVITDSTTDQRLLKKGRNGIFAYTLYHFYATQSAIQQTNSVWITDSFCCKGLCWGRKKFRQAKNILLEEELLKRSKKRTKRVNLRKNISLFIS